MDTTRGILFLVVTLIIIVSIYYIVKMFKGRTPLSPSPSPPDQTDKISISDLKFERTLNPDKSNSKGDDGIVGYTIEYDNGINDEGPSPSPSGINYNELSENVTFTLSWKNNIGFTGNVTGFEIEHHVKNDGNTYDLKQYIDFNEETDPKADVNNFKINTARIKSNGKYSVVGENRFKIFVIMKNGDLTEIYDGTEQDDKSHGIEISKEDLGATLSMTQPETVTYTPVTRSFGSTTVEIKKTKYQIYNPVRSLSLGRTFIYLMPATPGDENTNEKNVETFFFKYEDGQYLLNNLKKGKWNEQTSRAPPSNVNYDINTHDNRMFVSFYDKGEDKDGKVTAQLRYTKMGYGAGTHAITTDENGKLEFMDLSDIDKVSVSETQFNNSVWTFREYDGKFPVPVPELICNDFYIEWKSGVSTQYLNLRTDSVDGSFFVKWDAWVNSKDTEDFLFGIDVFESEDGTPLYGIKHKNGKYIVPEKNASDYIGWSVVEKSGTYNLNTWKELLDNEIYDNVSLNCKTKEDYKTLGSISSELISVFESYAGHRGLSIVSTLINAIMI